MAETVGSHTIATFTSPVNGTTPIDANTVRGNDNVIQTAYNAHDTDTGIHVQSSALASRPAAGTAGRKWMTVDGTVQRLWYDTGSVWLEVQAAALSTARTLWGQSFDGSANVSGSLSSVTDIGMSGTLTIGSDVALSRGAANRLDLATGDNLNLVNGAYLIGAASVLSATTLGSSVVNSSLTGVGTLTSGAIGSGFSPIANSALANSSVTVNGVSIALGASGTVAAAASTLTGTTLASNVVSSSLTSVGTLANLTVTNPISGSVTGSAGSVAASALTGSTLASGVTASSLTSVGTLTSLTVAAKVSANSLGSSVSGFSDYLNGGAWDILGASTAGSASTLAIGGYRSSQWIGINFYTSGVSRALIDNSGNLGLGVTPSAWSGVGSVLEMKGGGYIGSATNLMVMTANTFFNGANFIYKTSSQASRYEQFNGAHTWHTAPSGTAGNAISFTQAMTLDASGNLGVGTASPGYRLDISGIGKASSAFNVGDASGNLSGGIVNESDTSKSVTFNADPANAGASSFMRFNVDGTERVRIKSGGQVRFVPLAAAPGGAEDGDVYYDSGTNKLRVRAGGAWVDLH